MLEVEHLAKNYVAHGQIVAAVADVTLSVASEEFVAVRGRSGCGKSTLLLACGGLLVPDSGRVRILGHDLYALAPPARRAFLAQHVGFVFQQFHLVPYLTVLENILTPRLALASRTSISDRGDAELLAERFALQDRLRRRPDQLSVGERQRVALARALINRPSLMFADEPTGNLDPENSHVVLQHLREFASGGGAVLMVTHHSTDTVVIDRVLEMEAGRLASGVST